MKNYIRENIALSRFGVLVAQLESIVAINKPPDPLLCFDLLSDLLSAIDDEPKDSILLWQRKCEDALYSLLVRGARRPVRHLASVALAKIIKKGDPISIYSRASTLQGFLSDGKKNEPAKVAGAAQCLGELYRHFGRRITSGLLETATIVTKLLKFSEDFVRQGALYMLQNALEGSGGSAAASAYTEAYRVIMRLAVGDKSFTVRIAAARCLTAFASIGGPGLGVGELDSSASYCVKALEDPILSVRDAFAEALGAVLALGLNPEAQVQPRGKVNFTPKKMEGGLQRHLVLPFMKASGPREKETRVGLTLSWVFFLQAIRLRYLHPDTELEHFTSQAMELLRSNTHIDAQALACVLYILRVGVTDQMTEPTQRNFLVFLGKQLESTDASPSMKVAALRTLSYALKTLGEVPLEFKEVLDNTLVAVLSHSSSLVRVEAALTLRALAEVDPTCVGGLISYGVTTLNALRESVSFGKGSNFKSELDSLHGQATLLAALVSISPKLPLGYPTRLPSSVLEVSKSMLTDSCRNPMAAIVKKESGWMLLSSLLASMPMEVLEDQIFDILSLWAELFTGNAEDEIKKTEDLTPILSLWAAAIDALTAFIGCFITSNAVNRGLLLQPVLLYLSRALSYASMVAAKEQRNTKPALGLFIIRTLAAYMSISDPVAYKSDHQLILQICTTTFRDPSGCEESSCLRILLDKRDACLGPWIPGRDWLQDELRAFQGGKDGDSPCVWEGQVSSFPQPETVSKMLVNQKLLCFGTIFASQDTGGMLSILGMIEQCLKAGKKQSWRAASVTNICVGLLAGLKALLALRPQPLGSEILSSAQAIFLSILAEGDILASQRRAASEGLGLLARFGNDIFTARLTRLLLGDISGVADTFYAGSIAFALGCIHRSAGGMALSTLVPATVNSMSSLAKSSVPNLQIWSLHGLLLTIEAAGLSYVSQVQATLGLAMDILLSEENGWVDLQQGVGQLINAIVAVLGPELAPGSIFFSRCKSVVSEISRRQETATLLESVRFTQQLVLFAPQAVTVHSHVQTLLPTLSSRQPALRHLGVTTLRHLIEKDAGSVIDEQIEDTLFHMLDEETDTEIGNIVRATIMRLLYASCPSSLSHWLSICRSMILATSVGRDSRTAGNLGSNALNASDDTGSNYGDDDEDMVSGSKASSFQGFASEITLAKARREKHLRYRTRVFAAECLSHLPDAVGKDPAHFDLSLARKLSDDESSSTDWLVLYVQELISLAYQTSTIQFENMRPIGVELLSTIMDKFERVTDPDLPGHLLLEQYQAQLLSAVRTALDASSGPILLEAGLQLATKILTNGITSGDQAAVKRIFALISRPLNNFEDLYYPSFAEWVSCKIKVRLLTAHASLKCYTYSFLRKQHAGVSEEYLAQLPLFSESSSLLGKYWISILKDYCYICFRMQSTQNWRSFLDGIQSPLVSAKLHPCLEEAWPVIFQAVALDAVPVNFNISRSSNSNELILNNPFISGYSMVQLKKEDFQFLWGFALLVLFQGQDSTLGQHLISLSFSRARFSGESPVEDTTPVALKLYEIVLPIFQFLSLEAFFSMEFLTLDICTELLQVFSFCSSLEDTWDSLAISVISQIVKNCPSDFLDNENFATLVMELCFAYLQKVFQRNTAACSETLSWEETSFGVAKTLIARLEPERQLKSILAFLLNGYKYIGGASTESIFLKANDFIQCVSTLLQNHVGDKSLREGDGIFYLKTTIGGCVHASASLTKDCIECMHVLENKRTKAWKLLQTKLAFALRHMFLLAELAYRSVHLEENEENSPNFYAIIQNCSRCFQTVLTDTNIQVQSIVVQVLKSVAQRGTVSESNSFVLFFSGELFREFFLSVDKMLKIHIKGEAASVVIDILRLLVILHTLSKESECQKGLMNLLLEAIVMIFSSSDDGIHQELNDLRNTAGKLVSQLAQIPSSAVHLKDGLLAMPVTSRQLLQGILRASITQEQKTVPINTNMSSLVIKLPVQKEDSREKSSITATPIEISENESTDRRSTTSTPIKLSDDISQPHDDNTSEEEDVDGDDWDTFQSFPASTGEAVSSSKVESDLTDPSDSKTDNNLGLPSPQLPEKANESVANITGDRDDLSGVSSSLHSEAVSDSEIDNELVIYDQKFSERGNESISLDISDEVKDFPGSSSALNAEAVSALETDNNLARSNLQLSEETYESVSLNISNEVNDLAGNSSPLHSEVVSDSETDNELAAYGQKLSERGNESISLNISPEVEDFPGSSISALETNSNQAHSDPQLSEETYESVSLNISNEVNDLAGNSSPLHTEAVSDSETDNNLALSDLPLPEKADRLVPLKLTEEYDLPEDSSPFHVEANDSKNLKETEEIKNEKLNVEEKETPRIDESYPKGENFKDEVEMIKDHNRT